MEKDPKIEEQTQKLTDKAFSRLMLTSVLGILVCMLCLCSATWAWFEADVSNNSNTLSSGSLGLDVAIVTAQGDPVSVTKQHNGSASCRLESGTYTVTLALSQDTTVTKGFCTVTVNGRVYTSASLFLQDAPSLAFALDVGAEVAAVTLTFTPEWGMPSQADILPNGTLVVEAESTAG